MKTPIRSADLPLLSALVPLAHLVPAEMVFNSDKYQALVRAVPDWAFWASCGFVAAAWLLDPWRKQSRIRDFWHWATDTFAVAHFHAQNHWQDWGPNNDLMPDSDIGVRLRIRFVRSGKCRLVLRVFSCTGQGREPSEYVVMVRDVDAIKGQKLDIEMVDMGIASLGWDHTRPRGWGPDKAINFIGGSRNVAVLECRRGPFIQRHRFFVAMVNHHDQHSAPRIYIQDEDEDIFDTGSDAKTGIWRYD